MTRQVGSFVLASLMLATSTPAHAKDFCIRIQEAAFQPSYDLVAKGLKLPSAGKCSKPFAGWLTLNGAVFSGAACTEPDGDTVVTFVGFLRTYRVFVSTNNSVLVSGADHGNNSNFVYTFNNSAFDCSSEKRLYPN